MATSAFRGRRQLIEHAEAFRSNRPLAERIGYVPEAVERRLKTLDDFCRDFVRGRQQIRVVERMILHPEDVEIDLVARREGLQRKALELFSLVTG